MIKKVIVENQECLNAMGDIYRMDLRLETPLSVRPVPGQFLQLSTPDQHFLKRPFSLAKYHDPEHISVIYRVVGGGTKAYQHMEVPETLTAMMPLGNGFASLPQGRAIALVGGGVGIPPMWELAAALKERDNEVHFFLGYRNEKDLFLLEELSQYGKIHVATDDGSYGYHGLVTELLRQQNDAYCFHRLYACGPRAMLMALGDAQLRHVYEQAMVSLEERMACGFGACMGCTVDTRSGRKRVCKDGPVFPLEEVIYG